MMKQWLLMMAAVVGLVAAPAWAGHVYIDPSTCGPETSGRFTQATRNDNTGVAAQYVTYNYVSTGNPVMVCEFPMPGDNAAGTFQPQFHMRDTIGNDGGKVRMAMSAIANVANSALDGVNPADGGGNVVTAMTPSSTIGATFLGTQVVANVTNPGGAFCSTLGTACLNTKVTAWFMRLNDNDSCTFLNQPWTCCTGLETGSCMTGSANYGGDVEITWIDLIY